MGSKNKKGVWFGPSTLIAAAFIGPGTITVCTLAGAKFGYALIWALLFSICITILLQEMTARLGLISKEGLAEAIRKHSPQNAIRIFFIGLCFLAIIVGNAAYEAGNISGALLGLDNFGLDQKPMAILIVIICSIILWLNNYKIIEVFLVALVCLMSICFLLTFFMIEIDWPQLFQGCIPYIPKGEDLILVIALIGTTVVPYNLFLHSSLISRKWNDPDELPEVRKENIIAICIGGFISLSIMVCASAVLYGKNISIQSAADLAIQLEPLLGSYAKYAVSLGLFAAGISSALTAPLAAALAAKGLFGFSKEHVFFKLTWISILMIGLIFVLIGEKPIQIIKLAQVSNGILLPIMVIFLVAIMNKSNILGSYKNGKTKNILSFVVLLFTLLIAYRSLKLVFF